MRERLGRRSVVRLVAAGVAFVLGLVVLGGCAWLVPKDGQSVNHANRSTVMPDGVEEISVTQTSSLSGFARSYSLYLVVTVEDGFVVADSDALMDWLVRLGWSANEHRPTTVYVKILYVSGDRVDVDYSGVISKYNLDVEKVATYLEITQNVAFLARQVEPVLGSWPGEVPKTPSGVFAPAD